MKIIETKISGLKVLEPKVFKDMRGRFIKIYNDNFYLKQGLNINIKESYYSISQKNVVRGMHFQLPPHDHFKIVYVPFGSIIDVVLDIRKNSSTYGHCFDIELSEKNAKALLIPKGLAHGFKSLETNTNVTYLQTSTYAPDFDSGIRYDSFGYDWGITNPEISDRDLGFVLFENFSSPFFYEETE